MSTTHHHPEATSQSDGALFSYQVIRYTSNLVRDEWVNIGVLLIDPLDGAFRLRMVEAQGEFARVRRLHPGVDEEAIRQLRDHLEDRFATFLRNERQEKGGSVTPGESLRALIEKWNATLSNGIQLASPKGVYADDLDLELERLYAEQVAPLSPSRPAGAQGSRPTLRSYCAQVWRQAGLWSRIQKSVRVSEFTFAGDPMRIDYSYQRNGTRGFVNTLSVSRSPRDCKEYAYTAKHIAGRIPSEFTAVTDIELQKENQRHRFVLEALGEAGIVAVPLDHFATWVPKLRAQLP